MGFAGGHRVGTDGGFVGGRVSSVTVLEFSIRPRDPLRISLQISAYQ